jgi:hypothetical protein
MSVIPRNLLIEVLITGIDRKILIIQIRGQEIIGPKKDTMLGTRGSPVLYAVKVTKLKIVKI